MDISTPIMVAEQSARLAAVSAAHRSSASRISQSSGGQSALVAAAFGAAFCNSFDTVGGGLDDSPVPWGMEAG